MFLLTWSKGELSKLWSYDYSVCYILSGITVSGNFPLLCCSLRKAVSIGIEKLMFRDQLSCTKNFALPLHILLLITQNKQCNMVRHFTVRIYSIYMPYGMEDDFLPILQDPIPEVTHNQKCLMNVGLILSSYGTMNVHIVVSRSRSQSDSNLMDAAYHIRTQANNSICVINSVWFSLWLGVTLLLFSRLSVDIHLLNPIKSDC
jgi:hypothetical protein